MEVCFQQNITLMDDFLLKLPNTNSFKSNEDHSEVDNLSYMATCREAVDVNGSMKCLFEKKKAKLWNQMHAYLNYGFSKGNCVSRCNLFVAHAC